MLRCRCQEDGAGHLLEVAAGDGRVRVVGGDDLALLGQLEPRVDRARRLAEDRPVGRAAATPERPAAAVEQGQLDTPLAGGGGQRRLCLVEHPGGRDQPEFLVRIGVAEHDLLAVAARPEAVAVRGVVQQGGEDRTRVAERLARLEQGDDVEDGRRLGVVAGGGALEGDTRQGEHVGHVRRGRREADDVAVAGLDAETFLDRADRPERGEHLVQGHARRQFGRARRTVADRGEGRLVDRRVLADLERREVEPERADLPAKLGDLAVRDARQAVGDERVGDLGELGVQLIRPRRTARSVVRPRRRAPPASDAVARR